MIKILGIAICVLICSLLLKNYNKTISLLVSVFGVIFIFFLISDKIGDVIQTMLNLSQQISSAYEYIKLMVKVLGIILLAQLVCDICKDNGEVALSSIVMLSAKILVVTMIMPLFEVVVNIVIGLVK